MGLIGLAKLRGVLGVRQCQARERGRELPVLSSALCSESSNGGVGRRKQDPGKSWSRADSDMLLWRVEGLRHQLISRLEYSEKFEMHLINTLKLSAY